MFSTVDVEPTFANFVAEYGGLVSDRELGKKTLNADYIFHNAQVVAELKILKENPFANKEFRKSHRKKQNTWLEKGWITRAELRNVTKIGGLPDRCYRDIEKLYIRPLKTHVEKANEQIKSTKRVLGLPDYKGLLLMVSDGNLLLDPKNIRMALAALFKSGKFSGINTVTYLTINVLTTRPDAPDLSRLWTNLYRFGQAEQVSREFLDDLCEKWSNYLSRVTGIPIRRVSEVNEQGLSEEDLLRDTKFITP